MIGRVLAHMHDRNVAFFAHNMLKESMRDENDQTTFQGSEVTM